MHLSEDTTLATLAWVCAVTELPLHFSPPQVFTAYDRVVIKIRLPGFKSQLPTYLTLDKYSIPVNR